MVTYESVGFRILCEVVALTRDDNTSSVIKSLPAIKYKEE